MMSSSLSAKAGWVRSIAQEIESLVGTWRSRSLPPEFAENEDRLARFEREARLLAQLNHTNIATLHGLEEHDGQKFLVMELVEGETLAERIARGPIPLDEAIPLFIQIAEGLEAAHEKGIKHRDLKPTNIKIGLDGKPKILYLPAALSSTRLVPPLPQKDLWSGSTVEVDSRRFSKAMPMSTPASPPTAGAP
jgi:serine/threonine protein kinase